MSIRVRYKEYNYTGELKIKAGIYKIWEESGGYTIFYSKDSLDSVRLIVPTRNVVSIEIIED